MGRMIEQPDTEHFHARLLQKRDELLALQDTRQAATATVELDPAATLCIRCAQARDD